MPDNCLFSDQAGEVFEILMDDCDLHTILRLPKGTFTPYSPGVKANVIFFRKGYKNQHVWIYDCRTNIPSITKKERPLTPEHLEAAINGLQEIIVQLGDGNNDMGPQITED